MASIDPETERLKEEILKTGKPLEIRISSLLDGQWPSITNQDTFYDRNEKKLREIDICAYSLPKRMHNLELETGLIVECKKSEAFSWVFFTRPFKFEIEDVSGQFLDELQMAARNIERAEIMQQILKKTRLHYENMKTVAVTYEAFKRGDVHKSQFREEKNAIFDAQSQLKSYIECSTDEDIRVRIPIIPYTIQMSFPCIVFRGSMYEAIVKDDHLTVEKSKHLVLKTQFSSEYSIYEKSLLIDVVSEEYFNNYQELILTDIDSLEKTIERDSEAISNKITEIISLLESAGKR